MLRDQETEQERKIIRRLYMSILVRIRTNNDERGTKEADKTQTHIASLTLEKNPWEYIDFEL